MKLLIPTQADPRPRLLAPHEYAGKLVRSRSKDGLHVVETELARALSLSVIQSKAQIIFVLEGEYEEASADAAKKREAGSLFFRPSGYETAARFPERTRFLIIEANESWLEAHTGTPNLPDHPVEVVEGTAPNAARQLYAEFLLADDFSDAALEALAGQLFIASHRSATQARRGRSDWPHDVDRILRERFASPPTVDEIARNMGLHPGSLSRAYRRTFGRTVRERIRELRVEEACRRLERGETNLATIANDAGFSDQSHFGRVFRQTLGMTPARYRERVRASQAEGAA